MTDKKLQKILTNIQRQIEANEELGKPRNKIAWFGFTGVLLTVEETEYLVKIVRKHLKWW